MGHDGQEFALGAAGRLGRLFRRPGLVPLGRQLRQDGLQPLALPVQGGRQDDDEHHIGRRPDGQQHRTQQPQPVAQHRRRHRQQHQEQGRGAHQDHGVQPRPPGLDGVVEGDRAAGEHRRGDAQIGAVQQEQEDDAAERRGGADAAGGGQQEQSPVVGPGIERLGQPAIQQRQRGGGREPDDHQGLADVQPGQAAEQHSLPQARDQTPEPPSQHPEIGVVVMGHAASPAALHEQRSLKN